MSDAPINMQLSKENDTTGADWRARPERTNRLAMLYLNRLSDLLFILARVANPNGDVLWSPGGSESASMRVIARATFLVSSTRTAAAGLAPVVDFSPSSEDPQPTSAPPATPTTSKPVRTTQTFARRILLIVYNCPIPDGRESTPFEARTVR